jgi:hypothetical protein
MNIKSDIGLGYGKYMEILDILSSARTIAGYSIGRIIDEAADGGLNGTEVIVFSTYLDESIETRIELLKKNGNAVSFVDLREVSDCGKA